MMCVVWTSKSKALVVQVILLLLSCVFGQEDDLDGLSFNDVIDRMEATALELRNEVERLFEFRCNVTLFEQCEKSIYSQCESRFPNEECPGGGLDHPFKTEFQPPACGPVGGQCGALYDFSTSFTSVPSASFLDENLQFKDPLVTETACYTGGLDKWFHKTTEENAQFWQALGVGPRQLMFCSPNGLYRIYPARHIPSCFNADARTVAWYNGGSSGPRNVLILLDRSSSMLQNGRWEAAKAAAKRIASTLNYRDQFAIIPFGSEATALVDSEGYMRTGDLANNAVAVKEIDALQISNSSSSNYSAAFAKAFDVFETSFDGGKAVTCHSAVLFLSDGNTTQSMRSGELVDWIVDRTKQLEEKIGHKIAHFAFSVNAAEFDNEVHEFSKELACRNDIGIWTQIEDDDDVIDALWSYSNLFAIQLARGDDHISWSEPFETVNFGMLATAISTPAFAQNVGSPLFLGVVSTRIVFDALDAALNIYGGYGGSATTIDNFVRTSRPKCPGMEVDPCALESMQRRASGGRAICGNRTRCEESALVQVAVETCPNMEEHYSAEIWANHDYAGVPYAERACCRTGENGPSDQCPANGGNDEDDDTNAGLIGGVVGGIVVVALAGVVFYVMNNRRKRKAEEDRAAEERSEREKRRQ